MRDVFFRGKNKEGKWIYGSHFFDGEKHFIVTKKSECFYEEFVVDPKTLGEYTGVNDKEGKEIFEGDIVLIRTWLNIFKDKAIVEFDRGAFVANGASLSNWTDVRILGNKIDSVELAKEFEDN